MNDVELLQALIDQAYGGNQAAFARAIGRQPAQVNQYLKGRRQLGVEAKLHIEQALNRRGWFLIEGTPAPPQDLQPGQKAGAGIQGDSAPALGQTLEAMRDQVANLPEPVRDVIGKLVASYLTAPSSEAGAEVLRTIEKLFPNDPKP